MGEILHAWKWVFSTSHDPRAPSVKLWLHLFPVENCLGLGWLCYCHPAFCCYHFRRLALCAFIRKYMWQKNKRTECGPSQFGSSRERIAAANAANVQYAGQQRVNIIRRQPTLGPRTETSWVIFIKAIAHIVIWPNFSKSFKKVLKKFKKFS